MRGIIYLVLFWTFIPAIIAMIEFIILLVMSEDDFNKKYNDGEVKKEKFDTNTVMENIINNLKSENERMLKENDRLRNENLK